MNTSVKRVTAIVAIIAMLDHVLVPLTALALTGGPTQPEFSKFEPVSTTNMVNEFTGAFTYNLPVLNIPGPNGTGVLSVATANVGGSAQITVSADTGETHLPLTLTLCQTNPSTGACISPVQSSLVLQINRGDTPTFGVFVTGTDTVAFAPANNRVFVRFKDAGGSTRGATSVAVRTQ